MAILAGPILGEWVGWRRWTAIGVGFVGVLVVIRPGLGGMQWAALLSVAAAILYAGYSIATRMVMRHDSSETTLFYANLVGVVVMLPVLPFVWTRAARRCSTSCCCWRWARSARSAISC